MAIRGSVDFQNISGIDKLDVRIPCLAAKSRELERAVAIQTNLGRAQPNKLYARRFELPELGVNVNLAHRNDGHHKLELLGVGTKTFAQMVEGITHCFDVDPGPLKIMRVDVKADLVGFPVEWFFQNARVNRKHHSEEHGHFHTEHKGYESLYFGKRPNLIRIYDRTRCLLQEYRRAHRKSSQPGKVLSFVEFAGFPETSMVTRPERQYGLSGIPESIATVSELQRNAVRLKPFQAMRFAAKVFAEEALSTLSATEYLKSLGVYYLTEKHGRQRAYQILQERTNRNASRLIKRLENTLRLEPERNVASNRSGCRK